MSDAHVSITGVTGFLGWHLAEAFRDAGWRVTGIVRPGNLKALPDGVMASRTPLEGEALARAAEGASVIVHAAGLTSARNDAAFESVNVAGTEAVVMAANAIGARVVLISSQAVIGTGTPERPSREHDVPRPLNAYGRSKLAAEATLKMRARTSWCIVRPSAVYGPRDRQFLPLFRLASRGWFPLAVDPATAFTLVYVEDVARAVVLAAAGLLAGAAGGETLFIGHPRPRTTEDVLRILADAFQRPYRPWPVPGPILSGLSWAGELSSRLGRHPLVDRARFQELRAEGFVCAIDRAREVLNFTAEVELRDGVERTLRWYRDQAWV